MQAPTLSRDTNDLASLIVTIGNGTIHATALQDAAAIRSTIAAAEARHELIEVLEGVDARTARIMASEMDGTKPGLHEIHSWVETQLRFASALEHEEALRERARYDDEAFAEFVAMQAA
jgi:hypothetical protein